MEVCDLKKFIRDVPDFPKPGIVFKDITPLLKDAGAFRAALDIIADRFRDQQIDCVAGIESRGFIFGAALASLIKAGFIPIRKKGKLPCAVNQVAYDLEYGQDILEMHQDALIQGSRVLVVDDLLATGGTAAAALELVRSCGAEAVAFVCVVELMFLNGRSKISDVPLVSLMQY